MDAKVKEHFKKQYGKDWKKELELFFNACLHVDDPLGSATYYLTRLRLLQENSGKDELAILVDKKLLKEYLELANPERMELFIKDITELVQRRLKEEVKTLKDRRLRQKLRKS